MASNGTVRGQMRPSHGRSPPFIVIGLFVVIAILGFNYWTTSSRNSELQIELADVQDQSRVLSMQKSSMEKRNEDAMSRIRECDENLSKYKIVNEKRDQECQLLSEQVKAKERETVDARKDVIVQKDNLERCVDNGTRLMEELEIVKREKEELIDTVNQLQEKVEQNRKEIASIIAQCNTVKPQQPVAASVVALQDPNNENFAINQKVPEDNKRIIPVPNSIHNPEDDSNIPKMNDFQQKPGAEKEKKLPGQVDGLLKQENNFVPDSARGQINPPAREDLNNNQLDPEENNIKQKDLKENADLQAQVPADYESKDDVHPIDSHIHMDKTAEDPKVDMMNAGEYGNDVVKLPGAAVDGDNGAHQDYGKAKKNPSLQFNKPRDQPEGLLGKEDAIDKLHKNMGQNE